MGLKSKTPDALSVARIPLAALFLLLYDNSSTSGFVAGVMIALVALLTDIADGRLARRFGVASDFGALLDGLGDKAFYVAIYLVIGLERAEDLLLLWLLIIREICLYGLRIVDTRRSDTTSRLRWISLAYAVLVRTYFLAVLLSDGMNVFHYTPPGFLRYASIFAYGAVVFGFVGLAQMVQSLADQLPGERDERR